MKKINLLCFIAGLNLIVLLCLSGVIMAAEDSAAVDAGQDNCQKVVSQLKNHDKKLSREMRQVKRELAALQQSIGKPDAKDVIGGIGYILGLFGVAAYIASRKGKV